MAKKSHASKTKEIMKDKEDKRPWQEKFEECVSMSGDKEVQRIWDMLQDASKLETHITEEKVEELTHTVKYADVDQIYREYFNRKIKVLANRVDRSISENFGSLIKHLRESKGYSLKDLEAKTGISSSYINRIEKGERKAPSYRVIEKLAEALGQELSDLLHVANAAEPEELTNVEELLVASTFMINGKRATKESKERLVDIITLINDSAFTPDVKHKELLQIVDAIEKYKESLNSRK